jgi:hypothetical protein
MWRTRFRRGCEPVVEDCGMNEYCKRHNNETIKVLSKKSNTAPRDGARCEVREIYLVILCFLYEPSITQKA